MCRTCNESDCAAQNLTCTRVHEIQDGYKLECGNKTQPCEPFLSGYNCELCLDSSPSFCTDRNECEESPELCGDGECVNREGGYECSCKEGPCKEEGCTDALCGNGSCYQRTEGLVKQAECVEEQANIEVTEKGDMAVLECSGPRYMRLDGWFLGEEKVKGGSYNSTSYEVDRTKLKTEILVTCQLRSMWIGKIARDSVLIQPKLEVKKKNPKKKRKSAKKKSGGKKSGESRSGKKGEGKKKSKQKKSKKKSRV